jgi:hypothetical protein
MRLSNALWKLWRGLLAVLALVMLAAIAILCVWELYWAVTERGLHTISHSHAWITHESDPRWFVVSIVLYVFGILFAALSGVVAILGWRNERHLFMRWASRPALDDAIRLDLDSR